MALIFILCAMLFLLECGHATMEYLVSSAIEHALNTFFCFFGKINRNQAYACPAHHPLMFSLCFPFFPVYY